MSAKYELEAKDKLVAYATIVLHYRSHPHLVVVYEPIEAKKDSWFNMDESKLYKRLDEVFGGKRAFETFLKGNLGKIHECQKTIKRLN